jgi:hypothetical protein
MEWSSCEQVGTIGSEGQSGGHEWRSQSDKTGGLEYNSRRGMSFAVSKAARRDDTRSGGIEPRRDLAALGESLLVPIH